MAGYVRVRRWRRLWVGRDVVFKGTLRRFAYRIEARSEDNDMLMVSIQRKGRQRRETTFLYGVTRWMAEGRILAPKN